MSLKSLHVSGSLHILHDSAPPCIVLRILPLRNLNNKNVQNNNVMRGKYFCPVTVKITMYFKAKLTMGQKSLLFYFINYDTVLPLYFEPHFVVDVKYLLKTYLIKTRCIYLWKGKTKYFLIYIILVYNYDNSITLVCVSAAFLWGDFCYFYWRYR